MTVKLPDVSEFQAPSSGNAPNWAGIKSQNGGAAIIRVGYGDAHLDGMLVSNRAKIKSLKFGFCGLYQYLVASQDAASQARAFINWIGPNLNEGEIPMLDLEEGSGNQSPRANEWFGIIDAEYRLTALPLSQRSWLYSDQSFAVSAGLSPIFNSARRTWVAAYQASAAGLLPHTLWQSTNGRGRCQQDRLERLRFLRYVYLRWLPVQPVQPGLASLDRTESGLPGGRYADPERQEIRRRFLRRRPVHLDRLLLRPQR